MSAELPEIFAIIRQAYRGPCLQILMADMQDSYPRSSYTQYSRRRLRGGYVVINFPNPEEFEQLNLHRTNVDNPRIESYTIRQPDGTSATEVKGDRKSVV